MAYHADITPRDREAAAAGLARLALSKAMRMQTRKTAGITIKGPDGSKILAGGSAGPGGLSQWVGDVTPPGVPTGVSAESGAGLVLVSWDGGLEGGVPPDFDHVQVLVDGLDAGRLTAAGTLACGPYGLGSVHAVTAVAWDDAHGEDGGPAPNASQACAPVRVTVTGADVDPGRLGITVTKSDEEPQGKGAHTGDLWLRYTAGSGSTPALAGEWWWDGSAWVPIPVAIYLDQLAARGVQVDSAVIGLLSAGIIKSGTFATPDGLTGFDASGMWIKDPRGGYCFRATSDGLQMTGLVRTAPPDRPRFELAERTGHVGTGRVQSVGTMYFYSDRDLASPCLGVTASDDSYTSLLRLGGIAGGDFPAAYIEVGRDGTGGRDIVQISADDTDIGGSVYVEGDVYARDRQVRTAPRCVLDWYSASAARPNLKDGEVFVEGRQVLHVDGGGMWYTAEIGVRVDASAGQYALKLEAAGSGGVVRGRLSLVTGRTGSGVTDFTSSKDMYLPAGDYTLTVSSTKWGTVDIDGPSGWAFTDELPDRGVKTYSRYCFLTEK